MAIIDRLRALGLTHRPLRLTDCPGALVLSAEAGWNQTGTDWSHIIDQGLTQGVFDRDGRLVATAAIMPHGRAIGWICMVLVTADWRQRGIATILLRQAILAAEEEGLTPGLDATEAGRQVYLPLGFADIYPLSRLEAARVQPQGAPHDRHVRPMNGADLAAVTALDRATFGVERRDLLAHLLDRAPDLALVSEADGRADGFCLGRHGCLADHVGPIIGADEPTARALFAGTLAARQDPGRPLFVDVADAQQGFRHWLEGIGFTRQRGFSRMIKGDATVLGDPTTLYAIAGPELA